MHRKQRLMSLATLITVIVLASFAVAAFAASSANVLGYQIDFLGFVDNGNNTSTWTYAITADGDEPQQALSHWTLGIGACYPPIVAPANGSSYTTPTAGFGCGTTYNCQQTTCTVVHGVDATTGVNGIKFEDCDPQLSTNPPLPRTQIFQFSLSGVPTEPGDVAVAVKPGTSEGTGFITGPSCTPNAVSMSSIDATAVSNSGTLAASAGAMLLAAVALYLWRRQSSI